jgi:hypothetical protein
LEWSKDSNLDSRAVGWWDSLRRDQRVVSGLRGRRQSVLLHHAPGIHAGDRALHARHERPAAVHRLARSGLRADHGERDGGLNGCSCSPSVSGPSRAVTKRSTGERGRRPWLFHHGRPGPLDLRGWAGRGVHRPRWWRGRADPAPVHRGTLLAEWGSRIQATGRASSDSRDRCPRRREGLSTGIVSCTLLSFANTGRHALRRWDLTCTVIFADSYDLISNQMRFALTLRGEQRTVQHVTLIV